MFLLDFKAFILLSTSTKLGSIRGRKINIINRIPVDRFAVTFRVRMNENSAQLLLISAA